MLRWVQRLFLDRRAREALLPRPAAAVRRAVIVSTPAPERSVATALAEAEDRMQRMPPEKAQLIRAAMLVHRARQSVLADLSDEERTKLERTARKAMLGEG